MTNSLTTHPIKSFTGILQQNESVSTGFHQKRMEKEEPFTIPSKESISQEVNESENQNLKKNKVTQSKANETKDDEKKSSQNDQEDDSLSKVNPLAGYPPAMSKDQIQEESDAFKSQDNGDFFGMIDLKLKGNDSVSVTKKELSLPEQDQKTLPEEEGITATENPRDQKNGANPLDSKVEGRKFNTVPQPIDPAEKQDFSVSGNSGEGLPAPDIPEEKKNSEQKLHGDEGKQDHPSGGGAAPTLSMAPLDKTSEIPSSQSYGTIHRNEEALNKAFLSLEGTSLKEKEILQQMTEWMVSHKSSEPQSVRIKLSPETLGSLQIDISVQDQQVKADIVASSPRVKELLESHQEILRTGLADNGLRVDQLTVRLGESADYQGSSSMNFQNRFFQKESEPNNHSWNQNVSFNPVTPQSTEVEKMWKPSGSVSGGINIYI